MIFRVLHVVSNLSCISGVMSVIMNIYNHIDRTKVQFDFLSYMPANPSYEKRIIELGGRVYYLPKLGISTAIPYFRAIDNFFSEHPEYRIIHGHAPVLALFYLPAAIRHNIPYRIIHSHNTKYSDKTLKSFRNYFLHLPSKNMTNIYFACSQKAGEFLFGQKKMRHHQVHLLHNAIDPIKYRYNRTIRMQYRHNLNITDKYVVGHVGRFVRQKNHLFLIEIFSEIAKIRDNAVLLLAGSGELEPLIKRKVAQLGLSEKVFFLGIHQDIPSLMQAFDTFVFPSHFEGLSLVAIEAQAAGLPCFVSDQLTEEVKITELLEFLPIQQKAAYWAGRILKKDNLDSRGDMTAAIRDAGYDIRDTAEWLQKYYWEIFNYA